MSGLTWMSNGLWFGLQVGVEIFKVAGRLFAPRLPQDDCFTCKLTFDVANPLDEAFLSGRSVPELMALAHDAAPNRVSDFAERTFMSGSYMEISVGLSDRYPRPCQLARLP
jgi:hypothetical protein